MRAGAQWCTLCYTDLRPAPVRPEPVERGRVETESVEPELATVPGSAGTGKHARRSPANADEVDGPTPVTQPSDPALGIDAMLALLAAETSDPLAGLTGRFESTGSRIALMAGGVVVVSAVLFVLMLLIGSLL